MEVIFCRRRRRPNTKTKKRDFFLLKKLWEGRGKETSTHYFLQIPFEEEGEKKTSMIRKSTNIFRKKKETVEET